MEEKEIFKIFVDASNNFRYKNGIKLIEQILTKHPYLSKSVSVLCQLGLLYDHLAMQQKSKQLRKKYEQQAINVYKKGVRIDPKSPGAWWGLGRVWWHRKSKRSIPYAKKAYQLIKAKKKRSNEIGLYAQTVGLCYEAIGDYKNAELWLKKGLENNKTDISLYINMLQFYVLHPSKLKNIPLLKKKVKKMLQNESPSFRKSAWGLKIKKLTI